MKIFRNVTAAIVMTAAAALAAHAQQPAAGRPAAPAASAPAPQASAPMGDTKIALIDTGAFADQKQGIARFVAAIKRVDDEFQIRRTELQNMRANYDKLVKEISDTKNLAAPDAINQKADQAETLKKDIERKSEDAQAAYQRRMREALAPLQQDIGRAIEAYAKARGISVIIDAAQVPILYNAPGVDITAAFIADYNQRNPATAAATAPAPNPR